MEHTKTPSKVNLGPHLLTTIATLLGVLMPVDYQAKKRVTILVGVIDLD